GGARRAGRSSERRCQDDPARTVVVDRTGVDRTGRADAPPGGHRRRRRPAAGAQCAAGAPVLPFFWGIRCMIATTIAPRTRPTRAEATVPAVHDSTPPM